MANSEENMKVTPPPNLAWAGCSAAEVVAVGKSMLLRRNPFFGQILAEMSADPRSDIETIAVNRFDRLIYNEAFVLSISPIHLKSILAHEALHVALKHILRAPEWNMTWNIAADAVVNAILIKSEFELPEDAVYPRSGMDWSVRGDPSKIDKLSLPNWAERRASTGVVVVHSLDERVMEEVCAFLKGIAWEVVIDLKSGLPVDSKIFDEHLWEPAESDNETLIVEARINSIVSRAAQRAKAMGMLPKFLERLADGLLAPSVDWREILRAHMTEALSSDYTWSRIHRRSFATGIYFPGREATGQTEVILHIDTSASCVDDAFQFISEAAAIVRDIGAHGVLIYCDDGIAAVHSLDEFADEDGIPIPMGGRGTSHLPVVEWIQGNAPDARLLLTFTDGMSDIPDVFPQLPTQMARIIALSSKSKSQEKLEPYGQVVVLL